MRQRERCQLLRVSCVSFSFQNSPICKNENLLPEKVRLPESSCFTIVSTILPPYMRVQFLLPTLPKARLTSPHCPTP